MKPIDFSKQTFEDLQASLHEDRAEVHRAWLAHGPGTTREVSAKAAIDILTFRPRTTDLFQLGLVELVDKDGHQGVYRARTLEQWEKFVAAQRMPATGQLSLAIKAAIIIFTVCLSLSASADTASWYDVSGMTCASWDYPLGTRLLVREIHNGLTVTVTVNDRGPARRLARAGRRIDLSRDAFAVIDGLELGIAEVTISTIKP